MLALHDWQQSLQDAILAGDAHEALLHAIRKQGVITGQRIGIYQEAYRLRLTEALASNYPVLALYLDGENLGKLAEQFLVAHPSCHASIRWFGEKLPAFLEQLSWLADPVLPELARFEWALRHTVDAEDEVPLTAGKLQTLPPDQWPHLELQLQTAATILYLEKNTPAFWSALMEQDELPEVQTSPQHWLVYRRQDLMAMWRSMDAVEAQLLSLAQTGICFADMCEAMADHSLSPEQIPATAALLLRQWVDTGLLVDTTVEH